MVILGTRHKLHKKYLEYKLLLESVHKDIRIKLKLNHVLSLLCVKHKLKSTQREGPLYGET